MFLIFTSKICDTFFFNPCLKTNSPAHCHFVSIPMNYAGWPVLQILLPVASSFCLLDVFFKNVLVTLLEKSSSFFYRSP
ncbi:hypothetical protein CW304_19160 [Bacillus sp. UFRGS-B20]|nr:hypothetical protein CW304_19160 [Bacillus sp. UFRGS-B20]